jgi:hypothetical protein
MKKEYLFLVVVGFFLASYVLNFLAGPVSIALKSPFQFLTAASLSKYPFTAVEIALRTIALSLSLILILSLMEKNYLLKAVIVLIAGALGILYAIQQIATSARMTPIQWTLAFCYAGFLSLPAIIYYLIRGAVEGAYQGLTKSKPRPQTSSSESKKSEKEEKGDTSDFWEGRR